MLTFFNYRLFWYLNMINNLLKEWETKVEAIERSIFRTLIGTFMEDTDERSTILYYVNNVEEGHLVVLAIEIYEMTVKLRNATIDFESLKMYTKVHNNIAIKKFPKRLHELFKTVLGSTK